MIVIVGLVSIIIGVIIGVLISISYLQKSLVEKMSTFFSDCLTESGISKYDIMKITQCMEEKAKML